MKQAELVNTIIKRSLRTQADVGSQMEPKMSQVAMARCINNGNMTINRLWEICEILGYEIVVQPKRGNTKEYALRLEGETKADRKKAIEAKGGAK